MDEDADDGFFSAKHEKEIAFNSKKALDKKAQALKRGTLLEEEKTADLLEHADRYQIRQAETDQKRIAKEARVAAAAKGGTPLAIEAMRNLKVYVECTVMSAELTMRIRQIGMEQVHSRSEAKVQVTAHVKSRAGIHANNRMQLHQHANFYATRAHSMLASINVWLTCVAPGLHRQKLDRSCGSFALGRSAARWLRSSRPVRAGRQWPLYHIQGCIGQPAKDFHF